MARAYHSPSSDALARRCVRAWGYAYIEGLRPPDVEWSVIEAAGAAWTNVATPSQRSLALGTAIHAKAEAYMFQIPGTNFSDLPGQIFLSGAHLLPHPTRLQAPPRVERCIGPEVHPPLVEGLWHTTGAGTVRWVGYVDLRVLPTEDESDRLGLPRGWVTFDYKSTKDPKWIKTSAELRADGQANVYGLDARRSEDHGPSVMRWVYFRTQGKREARPVDFTIDQRAAEIVLDDMTDRALYLDSLPSVEACPPNPGACGDYGGCTYHHSKGGPCSAKGRLGALIQARVPKRKDQEPMGFLEQHRARQAAAKAGQAPVETPPTAPVVAAEPAPPPAGANGPAEPSAEPPPAETPARTGRGRPRATPSAVAAAPAEGPRPAASPGPVTCELRVTGSPAALVDLLSRFPA